VLNNESNQTSIINLPEVPLLKVTSSHALHDGVCHTGIYSESES